jgi:hypothetical protein
MTVIEPPAPSVVVVIGSYAWKSPLAVHEVLGEWWAAHEKPPVMLVTSGCPAGAEAAARSFGEANGWQPRVMRDEEMPQLDGAFFFGFVKDFSEGAEKVLETLEGHGVWLRVHRDNTDTVKSPWTSR